jgi:type IV secretory pathway VirJ component
MRGKLLIGLFLFLANLLSINPAAAEEKLVFGRFGEVTIYHPKGEVKNVTLFVSGDGGWNLGVIDMARSLADLDTLVVGINITHYLKELANSGEKCSYCAADFEELSHFVQKKLGLPRYLPPVLVGYSSGATLVYGVLVQAPTGTFRGAISLGFCPDLPLSHPLCKGEGLESEPGPKGKGFSFLPAPQLKSPWRAMQGTIDQVCDPAATEAFVTKTSQAKVFILPKVGHGYSVPRNWLPQFKQAFAEVVKEAEPVAAVATPIADLPVHEVFAQGDGKTMAVIITGDGGWAGLDRELAAALAAKGIPVVGLDSLQYFWTPRTPEGAARDLERLLEHYRATWHSERVILVGYSFGAEVLPFLVNRFTPAWRARIAQVDLLGPGPSSSFEFHLSDWLGGGTKGDARPVKPEVEKLGDLKVRCFYGREEKDSLCPELDPARVSLEPLGGSHHFGGNYGAIATRILE